MISKKYVKNISSLLYILSLSLWSLSVLQSRLKLYEVGLGNFGLATLVPNYFYLALMLLSVSFLFIISEDKINQHLAVFQITTLVIFLWLTPALIEGTSRFRAGYYNYGFTDYIIRNGNIDPYVLSYHNWPGFSILSSFIIEYLGISNPESFIMIYPALINIIYFPLIFSFLGDINNQKKYLGVWFFFLANWTSQDYFSPQSLAFVLYILIFIILFGQLEKTKKYFIFILSFSALVITHFLTSLITITALVLLYITKYITKSHLIKLSIVILSFWTIYGAAAFFTSDLKRYLTKAMNFDIVLESSFIEPTTLSKYRAIISYFRILYSLLVGLFSLSGLIIYLKNKEIKDLKKILLCIIAPLPMLFGISYGGELIIRAYFLSLPFALFLIMKNKEVKKLYYIFIFFIVIFAPLLHIVTHYGDEIYNYTPFGEIKGSKFFFDSTPKNSIIISSGNTLDRFKYYEYYRHYSFHYHEIVWKKGLLAPKSGKGLPYKWRESNQYVWVTRIDFIYYPFFLGNVLYPKLLKEIDNSVMYGKIYSNNDFEFYKMILRR